MISIIVPAHDERAHIGRTLRTLLSGAPEGGVQVIVVANGCRDETAAIAHGVGPPVDVLEIGEASKVAALNAGDARAEGFPRIYLDADVEIRWSDIEALMRQLEEPGVGIAAPRRAWHLGGVPWIVRSYLRLWACLPQVRTGLAGRGVMAVSEAGRAKFDRFPPVIADDRYLETRFAPSERRIVDDALVCIHAPRDLRGLVRRRTRVAAGNRELDAEVHEAASSSASLVDALVTNPARLIDLPAFVVVTALARASGRLRPDSGWQRDESTRADADVDVDEQEAPDELYDAPRSVSVVVPVRDAAAVLPDQLRALEEQRFGGRWEIILVDNGSSDGSRELAQRWVEARSNARLIIADEEPGAGHARRAGCAVADGELLAFTDADDVVHPGWVSAFAEAARFGSFLKGVDVAERPGAAGTDPAADPPRSAASGRRRGFLPVARGGNMAVRASALRDVGGWDGGLRRGQDSELSFRLQLAGHPLLVVPGARVWYRRPEDLRSLLRHQYRFGRQAPELYARFADEGAPRPSVPAASRELLAVAARLPVVVTGAERRRNWLLGVSGAIGRFVGDVRMVRAERARTGTTSDRR